MNQSIQHAFQLHQAGEVDQAIQLYLDLLDSLPNHFELLQLLGIAHGQKKSFELSLKYLKEALALEPKITGYYPILVMYIKDLASMKKHSIFIIKRLRFVQAYRVH